MPDPRSFKEQVEELKRKVATLEARVKKLETESK